VLAAPFISSGAQAAPEKFDATNPQHVALAYRKLGWSATEKLAMHWIRLTRYGLVDTKLTLMWESVIGIMFFTKDVKDVPGAYDITSSSFSFFLDPASGQMIEKYNNPWTGQTLEIPYSDGKPVTRRQTAQGMDLKMRDTPGMKSTASSSRRAWEEAGEIWVRGDLDIRMESESGKAVEATTGGGGGGTRAGQQATRLMQVNDWFTYHGKTKDVMDAGNANPASDLSFNDLNTWSGWLKMEDRPGNFVGRGFGRKVFAYDDMPQQWRDLMTKRYPDVAKNPDKWVRGNFGVNYEQ
jgi:hypothetical protein